MLAALAEACPVTQQDTLYTFDCPEIAQTARPGQFVELELTDGCKSFLRWPISIFDADRSRHFSLLVRNFPAMANLRVGSAIELLGPFGNGFFWKPEDCDCVLVTERTGVAALSFLANRLLAEDKQVRMLFASRRDIELLKAVSFRERIGIVFSENRTDLPAALISVCRHGVDAVFSCGSENLLEIVAEHTMEFHIPYQFSMM